MTHFFTIVCEYKGGTYTKQVRAEDPVRAFEQWAGIFICEDFLTDSEKKQLGDEVQYSIAESNLVALAGLQNVWYEGFTLDDDLLEVILIGMCEEPIGMMQGTRQSIKSPPTPA